jgi:UDP-N-acetylglucosamine transferase subunit ALG13
MPNANWVQFMPYAEMVETMGRVDSVVCHAGVGTIMTALKAGHRPVVIPREARFDEHVDDHQLDIATRFAERGLVHCVTHETDLRPLLSQRIEDPGGVIGKGSEELRAAVAEAAATRAQRRGLLHLR